MGYGVDNFTWMGDVMKSFSSLNHPTDSHQPIHYFTGKSEYVWVWYEWGIGSVLERHWGLPRELKSKEEMNVEMGFVDAWMLDVGHQETASENIDSTYFSVWFYVENTFLPFTTTGFCNTKMNYEI
jgi:hypothetical protein